jgi:hypothetical protein
VGKEEKVYRVRAGWRAVLVGLCVVFVGAAQASADAVVPLQNYTVGGTLGLAKLGQNVKLPAGARFNGGADITTGQLTGHVSIPEFTAPIRVLGIPTMATLQLVEAQPVQGTFTLGANGTVTVNSSTSSTIYIRRLGLGFISVPSTCRTAAPVLLNLSGTGTLTGGFAFAGETTIPPLTGCGLLGPTLSLLLSGPDNAYDLTLAPSAP